MPAQVYLQIVISPTKIHYLTSTQNLFQSGFLACLFYCIFTNSYFFRSWWLFLRIQHGCQTGFVWVFWGTKSTKVEEIDTNWYHLLRKVARNLIFCYGIAVQLHFILRAFGEWSRQAIHVRPGFYSIKSSHLVPNSDLKLGARISSSEGGFEFFFSPDSFLDQQPPEAFF